MPSEPPADPVLMEREVAAHIKAIFLTVPHVGHVHDEPQYPSTPDEAAEVMYVNDPVMGAEKQLTNYIEIGLPIIEETDKVGGGDDERYTGQYLTYPITFNLGVVPKWNKDGFPYKSSAQMAIGTYQLARRKFKQDRSLGFSRFVTHYYLQLVGQDEAVNAKGEATNHLQDWELTVRVVGNY